MIPIHNDLALHNDITLLLQVAVSVKFMYRLYCNQK